MTQKKVLVIDDSAVIRQHVSLALTPAGFDVQQAFDGLDAVERLEVESDFAAILCDVNMPRMNGIEFVEKVRAQQRFLKIPIVMLTTEGQPSLVQRAKHAGAKGWIVKPFKADLLVAALRKLAA